jgi:hypothetical protein
MGQPLHTAKAVGTADKVGLDRAHLAGHKGPVNVTF